MSACIEPGEGQRLEAAAEWLLRLRDETLADEELLRWVQWCEEDPRNQKAFDRVQKLWRGADALAGEFGASRVRGPRRAWRDWRFRAIAAALFALAVGAGWLVHRNDTAAAHADYVVAATGGELVHQATLADGSTVELAAKSVIAVHYSAEQRGLVLQAGEAYFSVAPNKRRPFVVAAGPVRARAVGTAFTVRRADDRIVVTVTHGVVDVDRGGQALRVSAGNRLSWNARDTSPALAPVDAAEALAWREGRLEYLEEPLGAVIADVSRYSDRRIVIAGDAIRSLRFSGTVLTRSADEWLRALPAAFPVSVKERDGSYRIEPRPEPKRGKG